MIMPDLSDYELMDVIPLLENVGCKVLVEGYGNKIRQSVRAGSTINKGQTIKIKLI
jgi:cell division protein FtsI (penicillin-binding protein 3)